MASDLIKELRIRPKTNWYHTGFKLKRVREFLKDGNKIRVRVIFRAREITHIAIGREILEKVAMELSDAPVESSPRVVEATMTAAATMPAASNQMRLTAGKRRRAMSDAPFVEVIPEARIEIGVRWQLVRQDGCVYFGGFLYVLLLLIVINAHQAGNQDCQGNDCTGTA